MVSLRRFKAFVAFVVFSLSPVWTGWAAPALAGGLGPWAETEYTAIRLIAAVDSVPTDAKDLVLGLEFRLEPGWHIYWRSPGDAGLPPVVDWSASDNLAQADIRWPRPERYELLGIQTLGYQDHVIFPVGVTLDRPGEALAVDATVNYLACAEICIPYDANLTLDLPAGSGAPGAAAHDLSRFGSKVPRDGSAFGFSVIDAEVQGAGDAAKVRIAVQSASEPFGAPDLIVEGPVEWTFDPATVRLEEAGRRAVFDLPLYGLDLLGRPAVGEALRLTLLDGPRAADLSAKLEASKSAADSAMAGVSFLSMLALALLGGLILNLMPCVLPVLSIKVLGILAHGGAKKKGPVRRAFLATAAGIVASFLVLAAALIAVKAAGGVVGWGIQFQQPWFLAALALMTGLF
ncbi:MAG: protein-disulfide reductase DsbD domain-containing protein, partial [Rhodospirillales bacterium]